MKLLLDESVPRRLARLFPSTFEVRTVVQMGWAGTANGVFLERAARHGFNALVTADQGFAYQQNPLKLPITGVVMSARRTRIQDLEPLVPRVVEVLLSQGSIGVYHVAV